MSDPSAFLTRRCWRPSLLALLLSSLSGCGGAIVGHWKLAEAIPNRDTFSLDNVDFRSDGSFTATTTVEGRTTRESGKFHFIGYKLMLRPEAGGQRSYTSMLKFGRLELQDGKRKVVLERTGKANGP